MENPLKSLHQFHTPTICSMSKFVPIHLMKLELIPLSLNQYCDTYEECFHDNPPPCAFEYIAKKLNLSSQGQDFSKAQPFLPQGFSKPQLKSSTFPSPGFLKTTMKSSTFPSPGFLKTTMKSSTFPSPGFLKTTIV